MRRELAGFRFVGARLRVTKTATAWDACPRRYTFFMSEMPHILVQKLHPEARVPRYAHTGPWGDLAADLYAVSAWTLEPGETAAIPTGLALGFPADFGALVEDRSGLALRGLTTLAGVIDPGYRGEIKVVLTNLAPVAQSVRAGDRIAQMRLVRRIEATFEEVASLDETVRGSGGFGSTGT
jgi:dUTP pyrophosphatase